MTKAQLYRWYNTLKRDRFLKRSAKDWESDFYEELFQILNAYRASGMAAKDAMPLAEKEYWRRHPWQRRYYAVKNFLFGPFFRLKNRACERLDKAIMRALRPN